MLSIVSRLDRLKNALQSKPCFTCRQKLGTHRGPRGEVFQWYNHGVWSSLWGNHRRVQQDMQSREERSRERHDGVQVVKGS